jgi:hypothetical protein
MRERYDLSRARRENPRLVGEAVVFADAWEAWKAENGYLDFNDLIQHHIDAGRPAPGNPQCILVDEAQDHSALELELLRSWARYAEELVIVGDPWQSLYEWRGAMPGMFNSMKVAERTVLDQSYRVPQAVHAMAMWWIQSLSDYRPIVYHPTPESGMTLTTFHTIETGDATATLLQRMLEEQEGSIMVMASCGYMLDPLVEALRAEYVPFWNPWKLNQRRWNPIMGKAREGERSMGDRVMAFLRPTLGEAAPLGLDGDSFPFGANAPPQRAWTLYDFWQWSSVTQSKGVFCHGVKAQVERLASAELQQGMSNTLVSSGKIDEWCSEHAARFFHAMLEGRVTTDCCLTWFMEHVLAQKIPATRYICGMIDTHGVEVLTTEPRLSVGTIHSFKGAEADHVLIFPDLSRAAHAKKEQGFTDPMVRQFYVAITRAKKSVTVCDPASAVHCGL